MASASSKIISLKPVLHEMSQRTISQKWHRNGGQRVGGKMMEASRMCV